MPLALTRLIAREELLGVIQDRIGRTRLATLTGAGGAGKTRVAMELASRREQAGDEVLFVELASVEHAWVGSAFAEVVAGSCREGAVDVAAAIEVLQAAGARALVVLDNCEHVLTGSRELIEQILARSPAAVLTTSRVPLGIPGEAVMKVGALPVPPEDVNADGVGGYPAVELFLDRAVLHDPGFVLDDDNATSIAEICRMVDGLPLAIEIAAAQLRGMTAPETAARMRRDLLALSSGDGGRRATLEQVLRWSHDLLDAQARELLRRLSVFAAGFTLEAAEQVCSSESLPPTSVYSALFRLVDHSLVQRTATTAPTRYRLFEAVRTFAGELLDAADTDLAPEDPRVKSFVLAREGDVWAVGRPGDVRRVKHSKGLAYLHHLIRSASEEVHALALATSDAPGGTVTAAEAADAGLTLVVRAGGAVIDEQALKAYRRRYEELQEDLADASLLGNGERGAMLREELAFLAEEIALVTGRGGRARSTADDAERARVAVTKAIRAAIGRVEEVDAEVGAHLAASVATGQFCSYDPRERVVWDTG